MIKDSVYASIHNWLKKNYGSANKCENAVCPRTQKIFHWALKHDRNYEKDREAFIQLCITCHTRYDRLHKNFKSNKEFISNMHDKLDKAEVRLFVRVPALIKSNLMAAAKKQKKSLAEIVRLKLSQ